MPQTLTGWILIAAILVPGMGAGSTAAGMLDDVLGDGVVKRGDLTALLLLLALMETAGLLLWLVHGR